MAARKRRRAESVSSDTELAPKPPKKARREPSPIGGIRSAYVSSNMEWDVDFKNRIGTATERLWLGGCFKLTDQHIDDILGLGPQFPRNLQVIRFSYTDVSYTAHNDAIGLTDAGITRLALDCPKLKSVDLPGTSGLGDEAILSLLEHCPRLEYLHLTSASEHHCSATEQWMETLCAHPEWAPSLETLRIDGHGPLSKPLRKLSKDRPGLMIELVKTSEVEAWEDWELKIAVETFKNGKKSETT